MQLSKALLLCAAAVFTAGPAHAALFEYQFSGTVTRTTAGSTVAEGDSFHGSWRVNTDQPGVSFTATDFDSRQYDLGGIRVELDGETALMDGGLVFVSESVIDPLFLSTWPSGFSSDYVANVLSPRDPHWSVELIRTQLVFSYDGLGIWNQLALPGDFNFLDNAVASAIIFETFDEEFGSGGVIIGRIDSVVATPVPVPSSILLLAPAVASLVTRRRLHRR